MSDKTDPGGAAAPADVAEEVVDPAPATTEVALVGPIERALTDVKAFVVNAKATVFDIATASGDKTARELRQRCVALRSDAKHKYEEGNAPFLVAQRRARALLDEINKLIEPVESQLDKAIKAREETRAAEKKARDEAERQRVAGIRARIAAIGAAVLSVATGTAAEIDARHSELVDMNIDEGLFGEFIDEASGARMRAVAELGALHEKVLARETTEADLRRQQAELAKQQQELADHRAEQARKDAAERVRIAGIQDRLLAIRECGTDVANLCKTARETLEMIAFLEPREIAVDVFGEFHAEAVALKASTLAAMRVTLAARQRDEAEALRLEEQRAAQERQAVELKRQTDAFDAEKKAAAELIATQKRESAERAERELADIENAHARAALEAAPFAPAQPVDQSAGEVPPAIVQTAAWVRAPRPDDEELLALIAHSYDVSQHDALEWVSTFDIQVQANRLRSAA